jgi:hypothetical protein
MRDYLSRYQQGECRQVWEELYQLGTAVQQPDIYPDAWAVARETMKRVRSNIETLIPRLKHLGYQFGYDWLVEEQPSLDEEWLAIQPELYTPPAQNIAEQIKEFEALAGPLPLSIRAFYCEVGEVNFFGRHLVWEQLFQQTRSQGLAPSNLDPLMVRGFHEDLFEDFVGWKEAMQRQGVKEDLYPLMIAPDCELKYNVSGAGAYEIEIPNATADAVLLHEWHHTTFVDYLRISLHYGGLPGLQYIRTFLPKELAHLRQDLLPI